MLIERRWEMSNKIPLFLSDEILAAYLEGSLPKEQIPIVEAAIESNPEYQAVVDDYLAIVESMYTHSDNAKSDSSNNNLPDLITYRRPIAASRRLKFGRYIAAAIVLFTVGTVAIYIYKMDNNLNGQQSTVASSGLNSTDSCMRILDSTNSINDYRLYPWNKEEIRPTSIEFPIKSSDGTQTEDATSNVVKMVSPDKAFAVYHETDTISLVWSYETERAYIRIKGDDNDWIDITVYNTSHFELDPERIKDYNSLEWTVIVEGKTFEGSILIVHNSSNK